jgi:ornithine carbamoyltransferase
MGAPRHFLDLSDFSAGTLRGIIDDAKALKAKGREASLSHRPLAGRVLAMIFDKPSTRTRVSFDVAMRQLGGETIMLPGSETQLRRGESLADTARVLSRYVDAIVIRILDHDALLELAEHATIPVINGLTQRSHPCQIMADVMTFEEHRGPIAGRKLAWSGDVNNVVTSLAHAAGRFDFQLDVAAPAELPAPEDLKTWIDGNRAKVRFLSDPEEAVAGADCIITDTWVSMGGDEAERRQNLLKRYQVNAALLRKAKADTIFMHCLPAHRGEEVTADVIDGPQSVVFDEAENRLHAQKGILAWCLGAYAPGGQSFVRGPGFPGHGIGGRCAFILIQSKWNRR